MYIHSYYIYIYIYIYIYMRYIYINDWRLTVTIHYFKNN